MNSSWISLMKATQSFAAVARASFEEYGSRHEKSPTFGGASFHVPGAMKAGPRKSGISEACLGGLPHSFRAPFVRRKLTPHEMHRPPRGESRPLEGVTGWK